MQFALAAAAIAALCQCPGGSCPRVSVPRFTPAVPRTVPMAPSHGWYDTTEGRVWGYRGADGWIHFDRSQLDRPAPTPAPTPAPAPAPAPITTIDPALANGINIQALSASMPPAGESLVIAHGPRAEAFCATLEESGPGDPLDPAALPDDTGKPRVTAIGSPSETAAARDDYEAGIFGDVVFQEYDPSDRFERWPLESVGIPLDGSMRFLIQRADGEVELTTDDPYTTSDRSIVRVALRRIRPDWDPDAPESPEGVPASAVIVGAVIVGLVGLAVALPSPTVV